MKTRWMTTFSLTVLIAGLLVTRGLAQKQNPAKKLPNKPTPTSIFMRQKLGYTQKLIEGITLENYDMVSTNTIHIWSMTQSNIFKVTNDRDYAEKTETFQRDIAELMDAAHVKNTPDIIKTYSKVTKDCVDCHQHFRREQFVLNNSRTENASK